MNSEEQEELQVKDLAIQLLSKIDKLDERLSRLEKRVPESFDIFYRAPTKGSHEKLNVVLDDLHIRLNKLEEGSQQE